MRGLPRFGRGERDGVREAARAGQDWEDQDRAAERKRADARQNTPVPDPEPAPGRRKSPPLTPRQKSARQAAREGQAWEDQDRRRG